MAMRKVLETVIVEAVGRVDKSLFMELWTDCGKGVGNLVVHGFSTVCPRRNGGLSMLSIAHFPMLATANCSIKLASLMLPDKPVHCWPAAPSRPAHLGICIPSSGRREQSSSA